MQQILVWGKYDVFSQTFLTDILEQAGWALSSLIQWHPCPWQDGLELHHLLGPFQPTPLCDSLIISVKFLQTSASKDLTP